MRLNGYYRTAGPTPLAVGHRTEHKALISQLIVLMCLHTCIRIYMYTQVCIHACIHIYMYIYMHTYLAICVHIYIYNTYLHTCMCKYLYTHA